MSASSPLIVAIDGPAGAGKSTVARRVAERLGLPYIDTGAMYRAVAWLALQSGACLTDADALSNIANDAEIDFVPTPGGQAMRVNGRLLGEEIRTPEVSQGASKVSLVAGVRSALTEAQRRLGRERGCVMEGRDIGTVVFPDAPVKVFLTASPEERVRRRLADWERQGVRVSVETVRAEVEERDRRDGERDLAPMVPAPDAFVLLTDGLSAEDVIDRILDLCRTVAPS